MVPGLAWAIANHAVNQCKSFGFFATHFHELTEMSKTNPGVANYHVSAHTTANSITMMYEVKPGACDESFGIHVAELVKFPQCVIQVRARGWCVGVQIAGLHGVRRVLWRVTASLTTRAGGQAKSEPFGGGNTFR